ncbi:serine/threonine-protein kinase, partial [Enterobacter hormaechei]|uniref:serine/threonine-protein kinase n=1 Tax=Enterobacter hormaechei TaxID=158836 RepID=UPI00292CE37C
GEALEPALAAYIVAEACAGLHAAHEQGVVHRDVSPQNLFVTFGGAVKVLDFGIAHSQDRVTRTEAGQVKGKLDYMSPEQVSSRPLDRRSDVFALGVVLYELLTLRRLFKRGTPLATLKAILDEPVLPPSRLNEHCTPALEQACTRALARAADERTASA